MYRNHFNLTQKPFSISSDPKFLWLGPCHARVLSSLTLALDKGGVLVLTGDVGTGKTTLVNTLVQGLPPGTHTARLPDPCFEMHLLFSTIARNLGFEFHNGKKFETTLAEFLGKVQLLNEQCLVIIDEAQRIGTGFLKALYSWQDLGNGHLPITVLLVGQNEFAEMLSSFDGGRFLEKTNLDEKLAVLSREETADYVRFRMLHSGAENEIFTETALDDIAIISKGYPRMINILCDHCLLIAHRKGGHKVNGTIVNRAAESLLLPQEIISPPSEHNETAASPGPGHLPLVMACIICLGIVLFSVFFITPVSRHGDLTKDLYPVPEPAVKLPAEAVETMEADAGAVLDAVAAVEPDGFREAVDPVATDQAMETMAEGTHEGAPDGSFLEQPYGVKADLETLPPTRARESVKDFVDEVFKGVERRMVPLPDKMKNAADHPKAGESTPDNKPAPPSGETRDPGLDTPDPGDVIIWLLERRDPAY